MHKSPTKELCELMKNIIASFYEQARLQPNAIGPFDEDRKLTYLQAANLTASIAKNLSNNGVRSGDVVGILAKRDAYYLPLVYGVIASGGVYLPLGGDRPYEQVKSCIEKANCVWIISDNNNLDFGKVKLLNSRVLLKSPTNKSWQKEEDINLEENDKLAYILFTSGSSGGPKGVMIQHSALSNHIEWLQEQFKFSSKDRFYQKTPTCFDASTWELFLPLSVGASVLMPNDNIHLNPLNMVNHIIKYQINILQIVPAISLFLAQALKEFGPSVHFKYLFFGGETLKWNMVEALKTFATTMVNLYGPTECTCNSIFYVIDTEDNKKNIPIGNPIKNTTIYFLDEWGKKIDNPIANQNGELVIVGNSVGKGYINMPTATKESFYFNSASLKSYKTGDIVYFDEEKNLVFSHRKDRQIKFNGYRIELGEIENCLKIHPLVKEAHILIANNTLTAHIVPNEIDVDTLLRISKLHLPIYMQPTLIKTYKKFPLLPSGKLNERDMLQVNIDFKNNPFVPSNQFDESMQGILSKILGIEKNNLDDIKVLPHMMQNSIKVIQFMLAMREKLNVHFQPEKIRNAISLSEFSKSIQKDICYSSTENSVDNEIIKKLFEFENLLRSMISKNDKLVVFHSSINDLQILDFEQLQYLFKKIFKDFIHQGVTILVPTYTLSFCKTGYFHSQYSPSETGILGQWCLDDFGFKRTHHPIYSWAIKGPLAEDIQSCNQDTCFGEQSVFEYLYNKDAKYILLGCKHLSQIHYCEEVAKVPYRFYKYFEGITNFKDTYESKNRLSMVNMFVRDLKIDADLAFKYFDLMMPLIKSTSFYGTNLYELSSKQITNFLINGLKQDPYYLVEKMNHGSV